MDNTGKKPKTGRRFAKAAVVLATTATAAAVALPASASTSPILRPLISPCGGGSVQVSWNTIEVYVSGSVYDDGCGAGSYVQIFVSYYDPGYRNRLAGTAGPGGNGQINIGWPASRPGKIIVTACEHDSSGWHCGFGVPV